MKSKIIYLNGTSSSGKSTIAKELQKSWPNSIVVSSDEFGLDFDKTINKNDPEYQQTTKAYERCIEKIKNAEDKQHRGKLFEEFYNLLNTNPLPEKSNSDLALYNHIKELAHHNPIILVDDLISTEYLFLKFLRLFKDEPCTIYMVKIDCPLEVLEQREAARGDRLAGMASFWQMTAHNNKFYDLVVDSSQLDPVKCAEKIKELVDSSQTPHAFKENVEKFLTS